MNTPARLVRLATGVAVAFIAVLASTGYRPPPLTGQEGGDSCREASEEALGSPCVNLRYSFEGQCEGSGCWTAIEPCCLPDLVVIVKKKM